MKLVVTFYLLLIHVKGELIGCDGQYDRSKWDCNDYKYHFAPANLDQTLYCIEFDKMVPLRRALNLSEPVPIKITRKIYYFENLDPGSNTIQFKEALEIALIDERLKFDTENCKTLMEYEPSEIFSKIVPKLFFIQAGFSPNDLQLVLLGQEGSITLTGRRTTTSRCKIRLHRYPFDKHVCTVDLKLNANTYDFKVVSETILPLQDSLFSLESPDWNITTSNISVVAENGFSDHQGLTFELRFKRDMSGHLMHFYLPSMILCASSMMSLFIPLDLLPARMSLAATTCLSMITLVVGAKNSWPNTPYIKSIGYWVLLCYISVFYCLLEYCVVLSLTKRGTTAKTGQQGQEPGGKCRQLAMAIERGSRIIVPFYLIVFTLGYFFIMNTM